MTIKKIVLLIFCNIQRNITLQFIFDWLLSNHKRFNFLIKRLYVLLAFIRLPSLLWFYSAASHSWQWVTHLPTWFLACAHAPKFCDRVGGVWRVPFSSEATVRLTLCHNQKQTTTQCYLYPQGAYLAGLERVTTVGERETQLRRF